MKKILSLTLALALLLTSLMVPVYAEDEVVETAVVDITSIADGATIAAGTNLTLAANASSLENVKNVDFYANGAKLPGTIVGNKGSIVWYAPAEGVYTISTKVTYNGGATADGNESVTITALPAADDLHMLWPGEYGITIPKTTESTEYAIYGKSAAITLAGGTNTITIDMKDTVGKYNGNTGILIYAPEAIEGVTIKDPTASSYNNNNCMRMKLAVNGRSYNGGGETGIAKGFNRYVASGFANGDKDAGKYFDTLWLRFYNVPEGNTTPIYICGIYEFANQTPVTPEASAVLDGATDVCNAVGTFRIDFSGAVFPYTTKTPIAVKKVDGETKTDVEIKGYKLGTDYIDVYLKPLEYESQYEVSVVENSLVAVDTANSYEGNNAMVYVPANTFTFTTKTDECGSAKPVINISYPEAGVTCVADTNFAAQIVAPNSTIDSVKFYNGETELEGTVTEMTDGEYWFDPADAALAVGAETTITAKMFDKDGNQLGEAASATYTGAETPEYAVKGIYNGKVFVTDEQPSMNIHVVDKANASKIFTESGLVTSATKVSKVEFYGDDNVLVATDTIAPYTYDLTFTDTGAHSLQVKVYDIYGNVYDDFAYSYTVVDGSKDPVSIEDDFDDYDIATVTKDELITKFFGDASNLNSDLGISIATVNGSQALRIETPSNSSGWKYAVFNTAKKNTGYKVHYYEFDFANNDRYKSSVGTREFMGSGTGHTFFSTNKNFYTNATTSGTFNALTTVHKVGIVLDYNPTTPVATIYIDGQEWNRVEMTDLTKDYNRLQFGLNGGSAVVVLDNFKYTVYSVTPEYAVKGIYDGAVMVKEEEPTRTITVVDKAKANVVSTTATAVSKVEFYVDDVLAQDSTSNTYTLTNNSYGAHKLEVKVYDIYGDVHSSVYNYTVVEGEKNTTYSIEEDFAGGTEDELKSVFSYINAFCSVTAVENGSDYALKITCSESGKKCTFKSAPSATGRGVHYYEFDLISGGYGPVFALNNTELFNTYTNVTTNAKDTEYFNKNLPVHMKVVLDYNQDTPIATVYYKDQEWKRVELSSADEFEYTVGLGKNHSIIIDNIKYNVYDYPSKFGLGEFVDELVFENTGTEEAPKYTGRKYFSPVATNMTDEAVTVKYFAAVYDEDGRLDFLYKDDSRLDSGEGLATSWTVIYQPGDLNKVTNFKWNVGSTTARSAKLFAYIIDADGNVDISPIAEY